MWKKSKKTGNAAAPETLVQTFSSLINVAGRRPREANVGGPTEDSGLHQPPPQKSNFGSVTFITAESLCHFLSPSLSD